MTWPESRGICYRVGLRGALWGSDRSIGTIHHPVQHHASYHHYHELMNLLNRCITRNPSARARTRRPGGSAGHDAGLSLISRAIGTEFTVAQLPVCPRADQDRNSLTSACRLTDVDIPPSVLAPCKLLATPTRSAVIQTAHPGQQPHPYAHARAISTPDTSDEITVAKFLRK